MLKTLARQIKEYKKVSMMTPVFMVLEVIMDTAIPLIMASIIDYGVEKGDINHIYKMGALMIVVAALGLCGPVAVGGYLDLAHRVVFDAVFHLFSSS